MPWHAVKSTSCPKSRPWAVIKDSDGSTVACHATKAAAQKQVAALYANEGSMSSTTLADAETHEAPVNDLVRALLPEDTELRAHVDPEGDGRTLYGHFAVFDRWTEIDSAWEGHFMERIAPGAFAETIAERGDRIKVLYDHGQDPTLGNKPLGTIESLSEDKIGAAYQVRLVDTPYNNEFVIPVARAGLLGSSFRFRVTSEEKDMTPTKSRSNPDALPERTITGVELYEFGPVTFPAYESATAAVRSGSDRFFDSLTSDPRFIARFVERVGVNTVEQIIAGLPARTQEMAADGPTPPADADTTNDSDDVQQRCDQDSRRDWIATHLTKDTP